MTQRRTSLFKIGLIAFACLIGIRIAYYAASEGFSLNRIANTFPITPQWELPAPSEDELVTMRTICRKPFRYLAKGSQAYAFLSADGRFILKLFKCYHLKPLYWLEKLHLPGPLGILQKEHAEKRRKKIAATLESYKIARELLVEECGLIYLQIVPSAAFSLPVEIIDKLDRHYTIDLAQYGFIIQQRASLVFPSIEQWYAKKNIPDSKAALNSIIALIVQRSRKGIQDSDPDLHKNAGFIGTRAIFIDLGSFHRNPHAAEPRIYMADIRKITSRLMRWLEVQAPELAQYFAQDIQNAPNLAWCAPAA